MPSPPEAALGPVLGRPPTTPQGVLARRLQVPGAGLEAEVTKTLGLPRVDRQPNKRGS